MAELDEAYQIDHELFNLCSKQDQPAMTNRTLATIRKNASERIVIAETEFKGFDLVDIRSLCNR